MCISHLILFVLLANYTAHHTSELYCISLLPPVSFHFCLSHTWLSSDVFITNYVLYFIYSFANSTNLIAFYPSWIMFVSQCWKSCISLFSINQTQSLALHSGVSLLWSQLLFLILLLLYCYTNLPPQLS